MHDAPILIGSFDPADADRLGVIIFTAVRTAEHYTADQRAAWAPAPPSGPVWASRFAAQRTVVARIAERPVGFITLADDGYIDLAFVDPDHQRLGIGTRLYKQIEAMARETKIDRLHTEASHLVRGLFEQQGWTTVREQRIKRVGVTLTNFVMEKHLVGPAQN